MALVDLKRVKQLLRYNRMTGKFIWKSSPSRCVATGELAGSVNRRGYRMIQIDGVLYSAHRLAWFYETGSWPVGQIDHKNGHRDANAFLNLRQASPCLNAQNKRHARSDSTTGLIGVKPHLGKFWARISYDGKRHSLGVFSKPEEAHAAYIDAKRIHHEGCMI